MKKIAIYLLFTLSIASVSAQAPPIDSLTRVLNTAKEDTIKVMALVKLSFYNQSFQYGLDQAKQGLALAQKINYKKGEGACLQQIGNQYLSISNYPLALHYYLEGLKVREQVGNKSDIGSSYYGIGTIYYLEGDQQNAIAYLLKIDPAYTSN